MSMENYVYPQIVHGGFHRTNFELNLPSLMVVCLEDLLKLCYAANDL